MLRRKMHTNRSKNAIKQLIQLHQLIQLAGGTYTFSPQYRQFIIKRKMLLKLFNLPETDQTIQRLFEYPLSQAYDIFNVQNESICKHCAASMVEMYYCEVRAGSFNAKKFGESWTLDEQAAYVHATLWDLVELGKGDQDK